MSERSESYSARLRSATRQDHEAAESERYVTALTAGELSRAAYADLVAQHYFIYEVLEEAAAAMAGDPVAGGFVDDALTRLPSLVADLEFLFGAGWPDRIAPNPATAAYAQRMREVCHTWPAGFVAHHYTRYLGDLSGGLFVGRAVAQAYGLGDDGGVEFYRFPAIDDPRAYKDAYRRRLDAMPIPEAEFDRLIREVVLAYRHNTAVLAELGRTVDPFPAEVVAAISRHMNDDHPADSLLICRALGGRPTATAARMAGMDADGIDFVATVDGEPVPVRVPFGERLTQRPQVRKEVVRMYHESCAALGVPPRPAATHG
ncbi:MULTISPECIES: biliverdin-producing heme oxygenase [Polymorphospora]|uniref:Biliverdin-producing heme oxygenase n=1 Tax=Polymorphospora lycopeni TaxID=3140240 RepID=A0ABV5CKG1_9ACTN